jgi:hypothetical protein
MLRVKNWSKHQHFKDRTPPWIKLYRDILDDPDWHELDGDTAKVLISLWLIASEDETHSGLLPCSRKLAFRLRIKESQLKQYITKLSHWLIQDDINVISGGYQVDAPERAGEETETEIETYKPETETDKRDQRFDAVASLSSLGVDLQIANDWIQHRKSIKASVTQTVINGLVREAAKARIALSDAMAMTCERGWRGFKADWVSEHKPINGYKSERQERDSAFLSAIGLSTKPR